MNPFSGRRSRGGVASFARLFSTHPPTDERVERLRQVKTQLQGTSAP